MYSADPQHENSNQSLTGGHNRWIARHPILIPSVGFAIMGLLIVVSRLIGRPWGPFTMLGILIGIISFTLLISGLLSKAVNLIEK